MKSLRLTPYQDLAASPRVEGSTLLLENMCEGPDDSLEYCGSPTLRATLENPVVATDRRGAITYVFTQEDDGTLLLEARLRQGMEAEYPRTVIARLDESVEGFGACGDFLVLRTAASRLLYMLHRADTESYLWLGPPPESPAFHADSGGQTGFTGVVPSFSFHTAVEDLRPGLDAENLKRAQTALMAGYADACQNARRAGYRLSPVWVRVVWRLWDGSLLHAAEPQLVAAPEQPLRLERVLMALTSSSKGFTGVESSTLAVQGYRLKVTPAEPMPAVWAGVLRGAEIWVSPESDLLRPDSLPQAVYSHTGDGVHRLSCSFPMATEQDLTERARTSPMLLSLLDETWGAPLTVPLPASGAETLDFTEQTADAAPLDHCDALLGYGGFLHTARGQQVSTSMRGNPFATAGLTPSVGGAVRALWPQMRGGGAYTRQYIYAATDAGLAALTHDISGRHTNQRLISPLRIASRHMASATGQGLFAVGEGGETVCVRDARVETLLRQAGGVQALLWSEQRGWLMLVGASRTLVLQQEAGWRAFVRTQRLMPAGCSLAQCTLRRGETLLLDLEQIPWGETGADCQALLMLPPPSRGGGSAATLEADLRGHPVQAGLILGAGSGEKWKVVAVAKAGGEPRDALKVKFMARRLSGGAPLYRLRVSGTLRTLLSARLK